MYRKLNVKDAFCFARIVKKAGLKNTISAFALDAGKAAEGATDKESLAEKYGLEFILTIIESISDSSVEVEIYKFFGNIAGKTADEIGALSIDEFAEMVKTIFMENNLADFFTQSLQLQK